MEEKYTGVKSTFSFLLLSEENNKTDENSLTVNFEPMTITMDN